MSYALVFWREAETGPTTSVVSLRGVGIRVFLERIPAFVRKRVMSRVEAEVARRGLSEVSLELLHELRPAGAAGPFARGSRGSLLARNDPTEH